MSGQISIPGWSTYSKYVKNNDSKCTSVMSIEGQRQKHASLTVFNHILQAYTGIQVLRRSLR